MKPQLKDLEIMAREAGKILQDGYGKEHSIWHKQAAIDLVTEIDGQSEAYILAEIQAKFPGHAIEAEESGALEGDAQSLWYVDPLDGTVNYAHHIPLFCVSIGYAFAGEMKLGVVYEPMRDECFSAEQGKGAWLNGTLIRVSNTSNLGESLLVTGFPYDTWTNPRNNLDHFGTFSKRTRGVRRLGAAALDLCYVAAGRFDGYWELFLRSWDVAAGSLIAQEAGANVTNIQGGPDFLSEPQSVLAANPDLHPKMLTLLREER